MKKQTTKLQMPAFTRNEIILWVVSLLIITMAFFAFSTDNIMTLIASGVGVTGLLFNAKGSPIGQIIAIVFSVFYGLISLACAYYGEMLTYWCMTAPMAVIALISWLRNPSPENQAEVNVHQVTQRELVLMMVLAALVTWLFYYVLRYFHTANLIPSTISITTSFMAVYLTSRRSPYFALAYAANDVVLLVLWGLAALVDTTYVSVFICFLVFLVNDMYSFANWKRMEQRQK